MAFKMFNIILSYIQSNLDMRLLLYIYNDA